MGVEFVLRCPKCGNNMKYSPQNQNLLKKVKRCVYCGHSFSVRKNIIKN